MKARKKTTGKEQKIVQERKGEERIALVIIVAILVIIIFVSGFFINSLLNRPPANQITTSTSEPKAAIVDHLSLTFPNETFIETATNTLKQAGYSVDYYLGENVTVEFYRNLPTHNYSLIILRVHSGAAELVGEKPVEAPVFFFTSQKYSRTEYVWEQLTDQIVGASMNMPNPPYYFGITPKFATSSMNGKFQNTTVIVMGCQGLSNTKMAEAFVEKGAKVYISWNQMVSAPHTDQATAHLLQHLIIEKQPVKQAINNTMTEVGPDPAYNSILLYYPSEAGDYTIREVVGILITSSGEIQYNTLSKKRKINNL